jgi:hypothetical protein
MTLATAASGALKYGAANLVLVRYWQYDKYPKGEEWEANFPDTIYLVGCLPDRFIKLNCAETTGEIVYYERKTCSLTEPVSDYIFSWDNRTRCSWDDSICSTQTPPQTVPNIIPVTSLKACIAFNTGGLSPSLWKDEGGWYNFIGYVEPNKHIVDGVCVNYSYDTPVSLAFTNGVLNASPTGWGRNGLGITSDGTVYYSSGVVMPYHSGKYTALYYEEAATTSVAINEDGLPEGNISIELVATDLWRGDPVQWLGSCPGPTQCDGFIPTCEAGTLNATITVIPGDWDCP